MQPNGIDAKLTAWLCPGLLIAALLLGGGGTPAPLPELILQLVSAAIFATWLIARPDWSMVPWQIWLIAGLTAIVPLLQLIPLPPSVWHSLPGRELERDALALIGQENTWRSLSLAPDRTLASLLALGPPLAMLIMTSTLDRSARVGLLGVICTVGLVSLMLGVLQLTGGTDNALHFYGPDDRVLTGFQANRNSTADRFVIAMIAAPALVYELVRTDRFPMSQALVLGVSAAGVVLYAIGVVLTSSRTGIALMIPALIAGTIILRSWLRMEWRQLAVTAVAVAATASGTAWLLWYNSALVDAAERFRSTEELRPEIWKDSLYAARQFFPFGSGMGNFVPSILANERLEAVRNTFPNRAHNDFLELAVEAGIFGIAALGAIVAILISAAKRGIQSAGTGGGATTLFGLAGLILLALHSLVDYPLRSMALACLAAVCAGMLVQSRQVNRWVDKEQVRDQA